MKRNYVQHSKICFACGIERHKRDLGYDITTLKSYCTDKGRCPNGEDIPDVELVELSTDALQLAISENYEADVQQSLNSMLGKTIGARLNPALVMHLLKFAEAEDFYSINATVVHILEEHMANNEIEDTLGGSNFSHKQEPKAKTVEPELTVKITPEGEEALRKFDAGEEVKITVNDKPVTPVTDEEILEQIRSVEPREADDDDEFSF
jgi:hypothetical protein